MTVVFLSHVALGEREPGGLGGVEECDCDIIGGVEEEYRTSLGADEGFLGRSSFSWIRGEGLAGGCREDVMRARLKRFCERLISARTCCTWGSSY